MRVPDRVRLGAVRAAGKESGNRPSGDHCLVPTEGALVVSQKTQQSIETPLNTSVRLFSYGTLQDKSVQLANFGRQLSGFADSLPGFSTSLIPIRDPAVVATSGKAHHSIAVRSHNPADEVPGTVFEITPLELAAADRYEVSEYTRLMVTLKSGAQAWAYVQA
jgi:hypothetical protein